MRDPVEGLTSQGMIRTGASASRISEPYQSVLSDAVDLVQAASPDVSLYVYGSVATGQAISPESDIDLLSIGLGPAAARNIGVALTNRHRDLCRDVEIAVAQPSDLVGDGDESFGFRVFLRHYCVHLVGPDPTPTTDFAGDRRAARGFNGDIARHAHRWRAAVGVDDPTELGRRIARKQLLAAATLVSVHDGTWSTDRASAAHRLAELHPEHSNALECLVRWSRSAATATNRDIAQILDGVTTTIVEEFAEQIGLWRSPE